MASCRRVGAEFRGPDLYPQPASLRPLMASAQPHRARSGMPCAPSVAKSSYASLPSAYHLPPDQPEQVLKAEKAAATTKTIVKVLVTKRR